MRHVISINDLDDDIVRSIIARATRLRAIHRDLDPGSSRIDLRSILSGKVMATCFYEPSTRTRLSFEAAMTYLGGTAIGTENAAEFSSFRKGESLTDSFQVLGGYCDVVVGRFLKRGDAISAAHACPVPVINGGDGDGEHPTQALIDLFAIRKAFPDRDNLIITFIGDNRYSRTVRSLAILLGKLNVTGEVNFIQPASLEPDPDVKAVHGKIGTIYNTMDPDVIRRSDVVYLTRMQAERHGANVDQQRIFVFHGRLAAQMPSQGVILHPLPRNEELPVEVDDDPRARYFEQARDGLYVRMALLEWVFGKR